MFYFPSAVYLLEENTCKQFIDPDFYLNINYYSVLLHQCLLPFYAFFIIYRGGPQMYDCIFDIEIIAHPLWHSHYVLTNILFALESCPPDPDSLQRNCEASPFLLLL